MICISYYLYPEKGGCRMNMFVLQPAFCGCHSALAGPGATPGPPGGRSAPSPEPIEKIIYNPLFEVKHEKTMSVL